MNDFSNLIENKSPSNMLRYRRPKEDFSPDILHMGSKETKSRVYDTKLRVTARKVSKLRNNEVIDVGKRA